MRFKSILLTFLSISFLTVASIFGQAASHVVISEVSPMHGSSTQFNTGEFIELYNPLATDVTLGASVQIISGNSPAGSNAAEWQVSLAGKTIKGFGFFLIGDAGAAKTPDASFPSSKNLSNSGVRSCVQLRDGTTIIDAFGWDQSGTNLAPEGTAFKPSGTSSDGKTFERKSGPTAVADDNLGNAWDTNNNSVDFFEVPATNTVVHNSSSPIEVNPYSVAGGGIGSAQISPSIIPAGQTTDFTIKLSSDESDTISRVIVIVPASFSWSMNSSSVSLSGNSLSSAVKLVSHDTISISGAIVTNTDTGKIAIHSVTVPDSALTANFIVETSADTVTPSPIQSPVSVFVTKVVPIVDLHINDSQGVPAAPFQIGTVVTVSGVVTADFSNLASATPYMSLFLQDATGGVNIFMNTQSYSFSVGDSLTFTGAIQQYRGTIEIVPDSSKTIVHSHNNPLPEPLLLTCADVNQTFNDDYTEPNEGRLVRINGVTYNSANETITDVTGTSGGYIPASLISPAGTFDLIGILKQYKPGTSSTLAPPYTADYEVDARTQSDVIVSSGPAIVELPAESNIEPNSVTIYFKTVTPSKAFVRYGTTLTYGDSVVVATPDTEHSITLTGLKPATAYHYQAGASDTTGTNQTGDAIFSTESPAGTTGEADVFFNKSVDHSVATGENAQTVDIVNKFLARVDSAKYSIDLALYSFSGGVGSTITAHLLSANLRGVKIRFIIENDNLGESGTKTYLTQLSANGIPYITDTFDPINAGNGLMHNKFAVFDYQDTNSLTDQWVWTGSWNATDPGDNDDAQNAIEIQDKALANAYTIEFNEMWGSSTLTPSASQSRFGIRKADNTPHKFNIEGMPVELYFSPSDQTTLHIYETLGLATSSINVCMLTFTRSDLAQMLVSKKIAGDKVRVVMDNNTDSGNQFSFLQTNGVDVHLKGSALTGLLHHKYAVIDAEGTAHDKIVITGSHNWSTSAETANNENTLIIHSPRIANLYLQEFKARYLEAGGTDNIVLGVKQIGHDIPESFGLNQNYPNPFNPTTVINYQLSSSSHVVLKIYDVLGRQVVTLVDQKQNAGFYNVTFDAGRFSSGVYFYVLNAGGKTFTRKMLMLK